MQKILKGGEISAGCIIPASAEIGNLWSWGTFQYRYTGGRIMTLSVAQMRAENEADGDLWRWEPEKFQRYLEWKNWPVNDEYYLVARNTFQQLCHQLDREGHLQRHNE